MLFYGCLSLLQVKFACTGGSNETFDFNRHCITGVLHECRRSDDNRRDGATALFVERAGGQQHKCDGDRWDDERPILFGVCGDAIKVV